MNESIEQEDKERKAKVNKGQTISARRGADRTKRAKRRDRRERREVERRVYRFRVRVVRFYRKLLGQVTEKRAIELTMGRYKPRESWHQALSGSTIRRWNRLVRDEGMYALYPVSTRPKTIHYQVPEMVIDVIYVLRKLFGWGGHRIAAELEARGIGLVCGQTVYTILDRLGLPVKIYALKGRSDGIAYTRYEKHAPNEQWHIDLKHLTLTDGSTLYICIIIDDYSRYALAAVAGRHKTTEWVAQVAQQTFAYAGHPQQLVSDNGREFVSVWQDVLTQFGQLLLDENVEHLNTAPYYPQGNGKAEAFIKNLDRELLQRQSFETLDQLQAALDQYLLFYNNYRAHSALAWKPPVTRYAGVSVTIQGLAGIPGIEPMAQQSSYLPSFCSQPVSISPSTALRSRALAIL